MNYWRGIGHPLRHGSGSCRPLGALISRTFALSVYCSMGQLLALASRSNLHSTHLLLAIAIPMLRSSLRSARLLGGKPVAAAAGRQWSVAAAQRAPMLAKVMPLLGMPKGNFATDEPGQYLEILRRPEDAPRPAHVRDAEL